MKVIILMPLAEQRGGAEMTLLDLMKQGRNKGIEWLVIFMAGGPMVAQVEELGIKTRVVPSGRLREVHYFIAAVAKIAAIARHERADVIVSWMWIAQLCGGLSAMLAGLPALWYQQEISDKKSLLHRICTLLPARGVVTITNAGKEAQQQMWPCRPTYLVYPGVALDRFNPSALPSPTEMRHKLGLPSTGPVIGIVGRLQRWKGMHILVEAMPQVLQKYPDAHCIIIGGKHYLETDYADYVEELISTLGLNGKVSVAGHQRNIPEWMQAMDIVVHASDNEPFGIVNIEAMALGKPLIAGNAGGPTEIITDGVNGLLTPYGDADALAGSIIRYISDQQFAQGVGVAARQRALDFSTQQFADNFIKVIREAIPSVK